MTNHSKLYALSHPLRILRAVAEYRENPSLTEFIWVIGKSKGTVTPDTHNNTPFAAEPPQDYPWRCCQVGIYR